MATMYRLFLIATVMAISTVSPALAYTGPGLGAATIAMVVGFFASIFIALFAVIWYPVKRLLRNRKKSQDAAATTSVGDGAAMQPGDTQNSAPDHTAD